MEIENHQEVKLHNLLSYRKKIKEEDIDNEFAEMATFIDENDLNQVGGIITTVHKLDRESDLLEGLEELIEQSGHSREEILRMVISAQANQIRALRDEIEELDLMEAEPPRRSWGGLGLAGLLGYWLGGGFSRDD